MNSYFHDSDDDNLLLDDANVNMNCVWKKNGRVTTVEVDPEEQLDSPEDSPLLIHERIGTFGHLTVKDFHCHYHQFSGPNDVSKVNRTLYIVTGLCFAFMVTEIIGGYFAGSLAVMTDAAHLFSDMIGFMMSIVSIWISRKPATSSMTFGYHRAEVLGAFLSVLVVWLLASIFCILAIERMINKEYDIDANTMMIVAGMGLVINILMGSVLHGFCYSNSHAHSHGLGDRPHAHSHSENINIRAAAAHVIGDLLQSLGVLVAAITIKIFPSAAIADPICTVLFSVIVVVATMRVARDAVLLLIEANPCNSKEVIGALKSIAGVRHIHSFHVWSLAPGKDAVATHLAVDNTCDRDVILQEATQIVTTKLRVISCTIQVEAYDHDQISLCSECQLVQC